MSEPELKDTQPHKTLQGIDSDHPTSESKKNFPPWLVGLCVLALVAIGLLAGYGSGMSQRYAAQNTQIAGQLDEQFQLGVQAYNAGNYELAQKYFDFIISKDPNYPGIVTAYSDLMMRLHATITPEFSPTPVVSPTPDLRGAQDIYNTALQLLNSGDWNGAISNLDSLRKSFPDFLTAQVDGLYYMALRQRGVGKIVAACKDANLEGGIYDLTLAEHFVGTGNLDAFAESLRIYARLYIIGASYWDQDWLQAQNFFAQVMAAYPNMTDSSCLSATSRWVQATHKLADQYYAAGEYCKAEDQYAASFMVGDPLNNAVYPTATEVADKCNGDGNGGSPGGAGVETGTPTETPTPTTDTATPTIEASPTDTPTVTPTP
jgi:outer membrane protein assembly factor BamD (BamD/ComL family)